MIFTLDDEVPAQPKPQAKAKVVSAGKPKVAPTIFTLDEETSAAPAAPAPGEKAEYLFREINPNYQRMGFWENAKHPGQLLTRENMFVNLYKAHQNGTLDKEWSSLVQSGKDLMTKETWSALKSQIQEDPGKFFAETFWNGTFANPQLLAAGLGLGGATGRVIPGMKAAQAGRASGMAARAAVRIGEGAVVGGGLNAAVSGAEQLADKGFMDTGELEQQAAMGAVAGGAFNLLFGRINAKGKNPNKPITEPDAPVDAPPGPSDPFSPETFGATPNAYRNAANVAYDLLSKGASIKSTLAARKKNPLVGKILDAMVERRQMATDALKDVRQGEVLGPETAMEQPRQALGPTRLALPGPRQRTERAPGRDFVEVGKADPELLARMALTGGAAALGATLTPEEPWQGAVGGAAATFAPGLAARALSRQAEFSSGGPRAQQGMFLPERNPQNIRSAVQMEQAGKSREEIWDTLQLMKGQDGIWRKEISDQSARLRTENLEPTFTDANALRPRDEQNLRYSDLVEHPELFRQVPGLAERPVEALPLGGGSKGYYNPRTDSFGVAPGRQNDMLGVVLHEGQHYVQEQNAMAKGGNSRQFLSEQEKAFIASTDVAHGKLRQQPGWKLIDTMALQDAVIKSEAGKRVNEWEAQQLAAASRLPEFPQAREIVTRMAEAERLKRGAFENYRRLGGEQEANLVAQRRTDSQRYPWKQFEAPESEHILQFGDETAQAVKEPGGMWHPEAVERLSRPLLGNATPEAIRGLERAFAHDPVGGASHIEPRKAYASNITRMVQTYLNRYAGTTRDPLKDIEVPYGEGTKRWEELTDAVAKSTPAGFGADAPGARSGEAIWQLASGGTEEKALTSYLRHVGDYLGQNVDPAKLPQYDLVRAVKETAANDARVAREMEKAASAETAQLPVYRAYPDGYKWVELKLPEKLTPEQARGVRRATEKDPIRSDRFGQMAEIDEPPKLYVALDQDGKIVTNNYTKETAVGETPQEAWLAGQLAREGNTMGQCVGGYCEDVASGNTKIYSLRDPKGKSHVTVEVEPGDPAHSYIPEGASVPPENILQIKGKQNRAPNEAYLPYVQDFVKGEKWGDVRDLENTGLHRRDALPREEQALVPPDQTYLTIDEVKQLREGRDWTPLDDRAELPDWGEDVLPNGPGRNQRGSANPELLKKLALTGAGALGGAALLNEDPFWGAFLGAGAGYLAGKNPTEVRQGIDRVITPISTRLRNISEPLRLRAVGMERNIRQRNHDEIAKGDPFLVRLEKLKNIEGVDELNRSILTNDPAKTRKLLLQFGDRELVSEWDQLQAGLRELGKEAQGVGRFKNLTAGYFPRIVKDRAGLLGALEVNEKEMLQKAITKAQTDAMRARGTPLTELEQSDVINSFMQSRPRKGNQPGYAKPRSVEEVTKELEPFYASPTEAYHTYIQNVVEDLERAKFFGKDEVLTKKKGQTYTNLEASVGKLIDREVKDGRLTMEQTDEIREILRARFSGGGKPMLGLFQDAKNLSYAALLGDATSAVVQGGDVFTPWYAFGLRPTLQAIGQKLTGKMETSARAIGLADHLSEEFAGTRGTARLLNKVFKGAGFSAIDLFGKDVTLNAALNKARAQAQTAKGMQQLVERYGEGFGGDLPQLLRDLKSGAKTELTDLLAFSELSDLQPISKMEMPQKYLENPNGRMLYMLKTYMLKQFDIQRRNAFSKMASGNGKEAAQGMANLLKYAVILGLGNATFGTVKDWMLGKEVDLEAGDVMENVLKTWGLNKFAREELAKGNVGKAIGTVVLPPYQILDRIAKRDPAAVQHIPLVGKLFYYHAMGGKEIDRANKIREEMKKEREAERDPSEKPTKYDRAMRLLERQ